MVFFWAQNTNHEAMNLFVIDNDIYKLVGCYNLCTNLNIFHDEYKEVAREYFRDHIAQEMMVRFIGFCTILVIWISFTSVALFPLRS